MGTKQTQRTVTTKRVLWTSFFVSVIDVLTNLAVAIITGSVVMVAQVMEGLADLSSAGALLIGRKRSRKHANKTHPFGYGKEMYFWALVAAFIIMGVTASLSLYFGFVEFIDPHPVDNVLLAYIVLSIAVCTNGYSLTLSARKLLAGRGLRYLHKAFINSSLVAPKTAFVLDSMGTLAAAFGLIALIVYGITGDPRYDGLGAIAIGTVLAVFALILLSSARGLVAGKSASPAVRRKIREAAHQVPQVQRVLGLRTMLLGSDDVLINLEVHFEDGLTTDQVEQAIDDVQERVKAAIPAKVHILVEPESPPVRGRRRA
jgi:cation diffusion facilitator family transporter